MSKFGKEHLLKVLQTKAGEEGLRAASQVISQQIISAAKYYMGAPDGQYFTKKDFPDEVVNAKKAYITLNTILGGETAEMDRFQEGKKQVPELFTPLGVEKMITLFMHLYCFASGADDTAGYETVRACRQTEVSEGESIVGPLTSTTKLSVDEIMQLGYGNKNNLAICKYQFHEGAVAFDMEKLGKDYMKPEEREVLLLPGSSLIAFCIGHDDRYLGKDGKPALLYQVSVYPPDFSSIYTENPEELREVVYNEENIREVRAFYEALNGQGEFPIEPDCYRDWKDRFQKLVFTELIKFI
ncbi:MAG: hypothetical protein HFJ28_07635 [Clostridia bacterium]|nr:hypothetical protein [Clostridia bacterium]